MNNYYTRLFPCAMCGKKDSATEAQPFCGPCEVGYQADRQEQRREDEAARRCEWSD